MKTKYQNKDALGGYEQRISDPPNGRNIEPHYKTANI